MYQIDMKTEQKEIERVIALFKHAATQADPYWIQRNRKIDTLSLMTCILKGLKSRISVQSVINEIKTINCTGTAIQKAFKRCTVQAIHRVYMDMSRQSNRVRGRILAMDGSKINVAKENDGNFSKLGRYKSAPCGLLTALLDVESDMIVNLDFSENCDERAALARLLDHVKAGDTVIVDRGFYSDEVAKLMSDQGIKFVFRAKKNVGCKTFKHVGTDSYRTPLGVLLSIHKYNINDNDFRLFHSLRIPSQ